MNEKDLYHVTGNDVERFAYNFHANGEPYIIDNLTGENYEGRLGDVVKLMNALHYDNEVNYKVENALELNIIYKEKGFQGIIDYVKDELKYGRVTFNEGLYCITTSGWMSDELLVHSLINPASMFGRHYVGYLRGGAFYFSEDKGVKVGMYLKSEWKI